MNVGQLRTTLEAAPDAGLHRMLPGGEFVPDHFHVTEVGRVQKDFITCGRTSRSSATCVLQIMFLVARQVAPPVDSEGNCLGRFETEQSKP
ncbi:MAG: hypothetical protein JWO38_3780 [Gemmataceae bacterium]|nr:hypothetical protein [Gemmataceae bacterium]